MGLFQELYAPGDKLNWSASCRFVISIVSPLSIEYRSLGGGEVARRFGGEPASIPMAHEFFGDPRPAGPVLVRF